MAATAGDVPPGAEAPLIGSRACLDEAKNSFSVLIVFRVAGVIASRWRHAESAGGEGGSTRQNTHRHEGIDVERIVSGVPAANVHAGSSYADEAQIVGKSPRLVTHKCITQPDRRGGVVVREGHIVVVGLGDVKCARRLSNATSANKSRATRIRPGSERTASRRRRARLVATAVSRKGGAALIARWRHPAGRDGAGAFAEWGKRQERVLGAPREITHRWPRA